jgi:hypothetical protein
MQTHVIGFGSNRQDGPRSISFSSISDSNISLNSFSVLGILNEGGFVNGHMGSFIKDGCGEAKGQIGGGGDIGQVGGL